jgi:cytochrome c-type biogenesis protein CcmE
MGLGLVAIAGAVILLVAGGLRENVVYFLTPTELEAKGAEVYGAPLRLGGQVKPESVDWNPDVGRLLFVINNVMVKHSNEYRPPEEGEHPREVYRSLIDEEAGG